MTAMSTMRKASLPAPFRYKGSHSLTGRSPSGMCMTKAAYWASMRSSSAKTSQLKLIRLQPPVRKFARMAIRRADGEEVQPLPPEPVPVPATVPTRSAWLQPFVQYCRSGPWNPWADHLDAFMRPWDDMHTTSSPRAGQRRRRLPCGFHRAHITAHHTVTYPPPTYSEPSRVDVGSLPMHPRLQLSHQTLGLHHSHSD